jgi:hypothetical protein
MYQRSKTISWVMVVIVVVMIVSLGGFSQNNSQAANNAVVDERLKNIDSTLADYKQMIKDNSAAIETLRNEMQIMRGIVIGFGSCFSILQGLHLLALRKRKDDD